MSKNNKYEKLDFNISTKVLRSKDSNIGIVYAMKQGSCSLNTIIDNHPETFEVVTQNILNTDFTFIIPLRSPYEKWVSGNLQDLESLKLDSNIYEQMHYESPDKVIHKYFESFDLKHISRHARLSRWTSNFTFNLVKLYELENVYFINVKDLSKPSLIEWMSKRDKNWSVVKEIYKTNVSSESNEKIMYSDYIKQISSRRFDEVEGDVRLNANDDEIFNIFYGKFQKYPNNPKQFHSKKDFQAIESLLESFFDLETSVIEMIRKSDKFIKL